MILFWVGASQLAFDDMFYDSHTYRYFHMTVFVCLYWPLPFIENVFVLNKSFVICNLFLIHMYLQKSFDLKEVYKIMSFRDKMYLITFRHQCIWIYLHPI